MDRGARWADVHGVAQSRTRLKRLSMHACIGEGNGNSLQCSCLENPRDRGAWCAAVCGVAQSRTRLTRLSSSSSRLGSPYHTKGEEFPPPWIVLANAQGGRPQLRTSKPLPLPGGESYGGECPESEPRRVPSSGVYFLQRFLGHPSETRRLWAEGAPGAVGEHPPGPRPHPLGQQGAGRTHRPF